MGSVISDKDLCPCLCTINFHFFLHSLLHLTKPHTMKLQALTPPTPLFFFFFFTTLLFYPTESTQPPYACDSSQPSTSSYPFCKTTLPINQRVQDLVSHLTLDEKISQLVNSAPPIPRLGIPSYEWWSEALHGVADVGKGINLYGTISNATSFPQVILTAASFNEHLWYRIGQVSQLTESIKTQLGLCYFSGPKNYNPLLSLCCTSKPMSLFLCFHSK